VIVVDRFQYLIICYTLVIISDNFVQVLYHHISSTERLSLTTRGYPVIIWTKTFHQLHLIIPRESDCMDVIDTIKGFAKPGQLTTLNTILAAIL
jgi:hypothetical protein